MTPPSDRWPEGDRSLDFLNWYGDLIGRETRVFEFGCGDGRLAPAFKPDNYYGVDICDDALQAAIENNRGYYFGKIRRELPKMKRDVVIAHTVLLHIPDPDIGAVVGQLCAIAPRVVVSEMLGRSWRRAGHPPVFNRDQRDYEALFDAWGFYLGDARCLPVPRYDNAPMHFLDFRRG